MKDLQNIILIGMMGSGKTTVGRLLAKELGWEFIDTDELVEKTTRLKISEIFAQKGEEAFRQLESEVITQLKDKFHKVIATGGGVVLKERNIKNLRSSGLVIFLLASLKVLLDRLRDDDTRPLLKTEERERRLENILEHRLHLYQKAAHITIETDGLTPEEVVEQLLTRFP